MLFMFLVIRSRQMCKHAGKYGVTAPFQGHSMPLLQLCGACCKEKDSTCSYPMSHLMSMPSSRMAKLWMQTAVQHLQASTVAQLNGEQSPAPMSVCLPALSVECTMCLTSCNMQCCDLYRHITEADLAFFQERVEQDAVIPGAGKWEHMTDLNLDSLTYTAWRRRLPVSACNSNAAVHLA